jgi:hypothetical protein
MQWVYNSREMALTSPKQPTHPQHPRVPLDPVDSLPGQAGLSRDLSDAHCFSSQHVAHLVEPLAHIARLAADVGAVPMLLRTL